MKRMMYALLFALSLSMTSSASDPLFNSRIDYAVSGYDGVHSVNAGDLDRDGDIDIISNSFYEQSLSILLNNGNGTFQPVIYYLTDGNAIFSYCSDFDNDGNLDVAVANFDNGVAVLINNGLGSFANSVNYLPNQSLRSVTVADINEDAFADIIVVHSAYPDTADHAISVLINQGDGTFLFSNEYQVGQNPTHVAVGDINGDLINDLVISGMGEPNITILINNDDGSFATPIYLSTGINGRWVEIADLNNDSSNDLAIADGSRFQIAILFNHGDGSFFLPTFYNLNDRASSLKPNDIDNDGNIDLTLTMFNNCNITNLINDGSGVFTDGESYRTGYSPTAIAIADFDRDGYNDMATANVSSGDISILLNVGNNIFINSQEYDAGDVAGSICYGNFDDDSDIDLAVTNLFSNTISTINNHGDGTFEPPISYTSNFNLPWSICSAKLDADNDLDLAVANIGSSISILKNNGDGTFQNPINYSVLAGPSCVVSSDFDNDGDNDLAAACSGSQYICILTNNGDASFQISSYSVSNNPYSLSVADFDRDGDKDIAVGTSDSLITLLFNSGNGNFIIAGNYAAPSRTGSISNGDVDSDGDIDIVATGNNEIKLYYNEGNGIFRLGPGYSISYSGINIRCIILVDVDYDGHLDIALSAQLENSVSVLINSGDGTFGLPTRYGVGISTWGVTSADLDGDGDADLAASCSGSNTIAILTNIISPRPPLVPQILFPNSGANADSTTYLGWLLAYDPDTLDAISYTIQVDNNSTFASPVIDQFGLHPGIIIDDAFAVRLSELEGFSNLQIDTHYFWRIRADDNYGLHSNWTDGTNWFVFMAQNHGPNAPDSGFSPANGEEVISLTPLITWNHAYDPNGNSDSLKYGIRLSLDSLFAGFVYNDTTPPGINQISPVYNLDDNARYFYQIKTIDEGGLSSGWSATQNFWTNHYNFPPEPFQLFGPTAGAKQVDYYTHFSWGSTVDYDPNSSFTYSIETTNDSLFRYIFWSRDGLTDTSLTIATDSLINVGPLYWRVLATDDDSLVRIGGIPEGPQNLMVLPPGDANANGVTNGLDVTFLVNYFKGYGPAPDPILAGDANGSCVTNGIDVTYLVNYLKGLGGAPVRGNCGDMTTSVEADKPGNKQ